MASYKNHDTDGDNGDTAELHDLGIDYRIFKKDSAANKLLSLFKNAKRSHYQSQDIIYHEGNESETAFIITKGMVKLLSYLPNGRARIVRLHGPGNIVGMSGIVEPQYEHTAVAVNSVDVLKIPVSFIKEIKQEDPETFLDISEKWHQYLREADVWITQFSTGSIRSRVARLITFLSYLEADTNPEHVQLLTGEEMASILGVTPESVSRVVADFKRQKVLQPVDDDTHPDLYKRNIDLLTEYAEDL
ncbi:MAG: Crp/Fnr family transcriptional regulator [Gammaproteobacteria bacterium]|jgi:CRP-like cAMP-binding protein